MVRSDSDFAPDGIASWFPAPNVCALDSGQFSNRRNLTSHHGCNSRGSKARSTDCLFVIDGSEPKELERLSSKVTSYRRYLCHTPEHARNDASHSCVMFGCRCKTCKIPFYSRAHNMSLQRHRSLVNSPARTEKGREEPRRARIEVINVWSVRIRFIPRSRTE